MRGREWVLRGGEGEGRGRGDHVNTNFVFHMFIYRTPLRQDKYKYFSLVQILYKTKKKQVIIEVRQ